MKVNAMVKP